MLASCRPPGIFRTRLNVWLPLVALAATLLPAAVRPETLAVRTAHAHAELIPGVTSLSPRDSFTVALRLRPDSGWHVYWSNPGDAGMPPTLTWTLPREWTAGPLRFPLPALQETPPFASFGYEEEVWYPAKVFAGGQDAGSRVVLRVRAEWLICREECLPESADFTVTLDMGQTVPHPVNGARLEKFALARLPRPQPDWDWDVAYDDTTVTIAWDLGRSGNLFDPDADVFFFPEELGVLVHAAPQTLTLAGQHARLTMTRDDVLRTQPDTLRGVLVFGARENEARHGYALALADRPAAETGSGRLSVVLTGLLVIAGLILIVALKRPHVGASP